MSTDLETLKAFLLRPLFDQPDGTKGFVQPILVDEVTYNPSEGELRGWRVNQSARKANTTLSNGLINKNCKTILDLLVLMKKHPNFESRHELMGLGKGSFKKAEMLFENAGFPIENISLDVSGIEWSGRSVSAEQIEAILNTVSFENFAPPSKPSASKQYEDFKKELSEEWAKATLLKIAPKMVAGLSKNFMGAVVQKIVDDGVFEDDVSDLDILVHNKYEGILEDILENGNMPERLYDEDDQDVVARQGRIIETLGTKKLSKFDVKFANQIVTQLAEDSDIIAAFKNENSSSTHEVKRILWLELGLNHESGWGVLGQEGGPA